MPRRRLRTFTLWTGTVLCVLIAAAFVVSAWWIVKAGIANRGFIAIHAGELRVTPTTGTGGSYVSCFRHRERLIFAVGGAKALSPQSFHLPLIYPFLAVAIPTLLVWRFWPKPVKPGHCRCGYDLTGNTSGVCPECGIEAKGDAP